MTSAIPPLTEPDPAPPSPPLIACEMCGTISRAVMLAPGESATCGKCGFVLQRYSKLSPTDWLALTLTALILFLLANFLPIVELSVQGQVRNTTLPGSIVMAWQYGHAIVAILCSLATIILPGVQILLLLYVLTCLIQRRPNTDLTTVIRLIRWIRPWSMVPVFMLATLVALFKLADLASVTLHAGFLALIALTILITLLSRLGPHRLWHLAEQSRLVATYYPVPSLQHALTACHGCGQVQAYTAHSETCVRCQEPLHWRKPNWLNRSWALLITAAILYAPANLLPIMVVDSPLLGNSQHTILGGIIELAQLGSWDLAAIVFIASIVVPLAKILGLACLLLAAQGRWRGSLVQRTRLYQLIEFVGQWSMLDVFVVLLLSALAHFSGLMTIDVGPAATSFGLVVVLTMLAAMSFDPRSAWDNSRVNTAQTPSASQTP